MALMHPRTPGCFGAMVPLRLGACDVGRLSIGKVQFRVKPKPKRTGRAGEAWMRETSASWPYRVTR